MTVSPIDIEATPKVITTYRVLLNGIQLDVSQTDAKSKLAALFKTTPEIIIKLLTQPGYVLKKGLTIEMAVKYKTAIEAAGAICQVEQEMVLAQTLDVNLEQAPSRPDVSNNGNTLSTCHVCAHSIAKTADICPKCGAKNNWIDPRVLTLVEYMQTNATTSKEFTFYSDRLLVSGDTEFTTKSYESIRYALIALFVGIGLSVSYKLFLFLPESFWSIVMPVVTFGSFVAYPIAFIFFVKWIFHTLFSSEQSEILQKSFRVDFSGDVPIWQSNDDDFWSSIKAHIFNHQLDNLSNVKFEQPSQRPENKNESIGYHFGKWLGKILVSK